jgi:hypothetical protein
MVHKGVGIIEDGMREDGGVECREGRIDEKGDVCNKGNRKYHYLCLGQLSVNMWA